MPSWPALASQAFNGLALGSLLALVSSGLTIILGTLGVLNFAHGALFAVGAYAAFVMLQYTQSFLLAIAVGCGFMLVLGFLLERLIIRFFYGRPHEDQILVTYGIGIVLVECVRAVFGGNAQRVPTPSWGQGATQLGFLIYPTYRLQLIAIIATLLVGLYLVLYRTSMGLVVRAGIENPDYRAQCKALELLDSDELSKEDVLATLAELFNDELAGLLGTAKGSEAKV